MTVQYRLSSRADVLNYPPKIADYSEIKTKLKSQKVFHFVNKRKIIENNNLEDDNDENDLKDKTKEDYEEDINQKSSLI